MDEFKSGVSKQLYMVMFVNHGLGLGLGLELGSELGLRA